MGVSRELLFVEDRLIAEDGFGELHVHSDGAVIAAGHFWKDESILNLFLEVFGAVEVVDPPADISGTSTRAHAPPGVLIWFVRMEHPKGIVKSICLKSVHPFALHGEKARNIFIFLGPGEIDGEVGGIHVASDEDFFAFPHLCHDPFLEGLVELHFESKALWAGFAIGEVDVVELEISELGHEGAALLIEFFDPESSGDSLRLELRKESRPAIALLALGAVPIGDIALGHEDLYIQLFFLSFGFLQDQDVGLLMVQPFGKALFLDGTDAIDVPGDDLEGVHDVACLPGL